MSRRGPGPMTIDHSTTPYTARATGQHAPGSTPDPWDEEQYDSMDMEDGQPDADYEEEWYQHESGWTTLNQLTDDDEVAPDEDGDDEEEDEDSTTDAPQHPSDTQAHCTCPSDQAYPVFSVEQGGWVFPTDHIIPPAVLQSTGEPNATLGLSSIHQRDAPVRRFALAAAATPATTNTGTTTTAPEKRAAVLQPLAPGTAPPTTRQHLSRTTCVPRCDVHFAPTPPPGPRNRPSFSFVAANPLPHLGPRFVPVTPATAAWKAIPAATAVDQARALRLVADDLSTIEDAATTGGGRARLRRMQSVHAAPASWGDGAQVRVLNAWAHRFRSKFRGRPGGEGEAGKRIARDRWSVEEREAVVRAMAAQMRERRFADWREMAGMCGDVFGRARTVAGVQAYVWRNGLEERARAVVKEEEGKREDDEAMEGSREKDEARGEEDTEMVDAAG